MKGSLRAVFAGLMVLLVLIATYEFFTWPDVAGLATRPPATTAFIDQYRADRRAANKSEQVSWRWAPDDAIAPSLHLAVLCGEDLGFFAHHGFALGEIRAAIRDAVRRGRPLRGASTITQQLAKNLWLSPSRNPLRKVKEALLTRQIEQRLSKKRILELYLNVVEFGAGIYGAEAAARHYFGKAASDLDEHESALLAASLPRPASWNPGSASKSYANHVGRIEERMGRVVVLRKRFGIPALVPDSLAIVLPDSALVDLFPVDTLWPDDSAAGP